MEIKAQSPIQHPGFASCRQGNIFSMHFFNFHLYRFFITYKIVPCDFTPTLSHPYLWIDPVLYSKGMELSPLWTPTFYLAPSITTAWWYTATPFPPWNNPLIAAVVRNETWTLGAHRQMGIQNVQGKRDSPELGSSGLSTTNYFHGRDEARDSPSRELCQGRAH